MKNPRYQVGDTIYLVQDMGLLRKRQLETRSKGELDPNWNNSMFPDGPQLIKELDPGHGSCHDEFVYILDGPLSRWYYVDYMIDHERTQGGILDTPIPV